MIKKIFLLTLFTLFLTSCSNDEKVLQNSSQENSIEQPAITEEAQIPNPEQVVKFNDQLLEDYVRNSLGKLEGDLTVSDISQLYYLDIPEGTFDLKGLEYASGATSLSIYKTKIKSLEPVSKLSSLTYVTMSYSVVESVPDEVTWPNVETLNFIDLTIPNFDFVSSMNSLRIYTNTDSELSNLDHLSKNTNLEDLNISYSPISDITPIKDFVNIKSLDISHCNIESIEPIRGFVNLEYLDIAYNKITNLEPILDLPNIKELCAWDDPDKNKWLLDRGQLQALENKGVYVDYYGK
jgi:Leucine-rich repeat (LRR) protein